MPALPLMIIRHAEKPKRVRPGPGLTIKETRRKSHLSFAAGSGPARGRGCLARVSAKPIFHSPGPFTPATPIPISRYPNRLSNLASGLLRPFNR
jgi:hypothetical protein